MVALCNTFHLWGETRSELPPSIFNNYLHQDLDKAWHSWMFPGSGIQSFFFRQSRCLKAKHISFYDQYRWFRSLAELVSIAPYSMWPRDMILSNCRYYQGFFERKPLLSPQFNMNHHASLSKKHDFNCGLPLKFQNVHTFRPCNGAWLLILWSEMRLPN